MELDFRKVDYPEHLEEIGRLRARVWSAKGCLNSDQIADGIWLDGYDSKAHHWVCLHERKIVASARLHIEQILENLPYAFEWVGLETEISMPVALMMRLVVLERFRGLAIAKTLDDLRIDFARKSGACTMLGSAAPERLSGLQSKGFRLLRTLPESARTSGLTDVGFLVAKDLAAEH